MFASPLGDDGLRLVVPAVFHLSMLAGPERDVVTNAPSSLAVIVATMYQPR